MLIFRWVIGLRGTGSSDAVRDPYISHITIIRGGFTKPLPYTKQPIIGPSPPLHPLEEATPPIVSPKMAYLLDLTLSISPYNLLLNC